ARTATLSSIGAMGIKLRSPGKKVHKAWLNQHVNDPYVRQAQKDGYRARAAYKLKETDEQFRLIPPGMCVASPGRTPGARTPSGAATGALQGSIVALDLLPMEPVDGVHFIQGDFREDAVLAELEQALAERGHAQVDLVVSDMAPNLSGIESADAARIEHLVEL